MDKEELQEAELQLYGAFRECYEYECELDDLVNVIALRGAIRKFLTEGAKHLSHDVADYTFIIADNDGIEELMEEEADSHWPGILSEIEDGLGRSDYSFYAVLDVERTKEVYMQDFLYHHSAADELAYYDNEVVELHIKGIGYITMFIR